MSIEELRQTGNFLYRIIYTVIIAHKLSDEKVVSQLIKTNLEKLFTT